MIGYKLSLGNIIAYHMIHVVELKSVPLPYAEVITLLLKAHHVSIRNDFREVSSEQINSTTLKQMKIFKGPDGVWFFKSHTSGASSSCGNTNEEDEIQEELDAAATAAGYGAGQDHDDVPIGPQASAFQFTEEHYNMMQARLDSLTVSVDELRGASNARFDHFDISLTELSSSFNTMALNQ